MELKLKILEGRHAGQELKITKPKFLVGRAEDCHLRPNSEKISRHHCVIQLSEGMISVRDLGSKNGTLVNGERVIGEQELKNGDILEFGPLKFEVRPTVDIKREKKPVVKSVKEAVIRTSQTQSKEMDVADWLMDATEPKVPSDEDTMSLSNVNLDDLVQPKSIAPKPIAPKPSPAPQPAPVAESPAAAPPPSNRITPPPKTTSADSMSAAAEALKKMSRRR